jgi:hypothetical protein
MENARNHEGLAIQQDNVSTDQYMLVIRRRGRQAPLEVLRTGLNLLPQSWRKSATLSKLLFESRRKLLALGEAGRQISAVLVFVIPLAHDVAVIIVRPGRVAVALILVVSVSVTLRRSCAAGQG